MKKNKDYDIIRHIGVLSEKENGWRKELNLISWFDKPPKFDIRDWGPERERFGKGITLTFTEFFTLKYMSINDERMKEIIDSKSV